MQPQTVAVAKVGYLGHRVNAGGRGRAHGRHRKRPQTGCEIVLDGLLKLGHIHAQSAVGANFVQSYLTQHDACFFHRAMGFRRGIVAQGRKIGPTGHAKLANTSMGDGLASCGQGT